MKLPSLQRRLSQALGVFFTTAISIGVASAATHTYQYFQFKPTKLRSGTTIQISEFQFFNGATAIPVTGVTVTQPNPDQSPAAEGVANVFDANNNNKWLNFDFAATSLTFNFGASVTIDSYNYITGNDSPERSPVSWSIYGSTDGIDWTLLDLRSDTSPSVSANVAAYATNFVLPAAPEPTIPFFEFGDTSQPPIVTNGSTVNLYFEPTDTTTAVLSNNVNTTTQTVSSPYPAFFDVLPPDSSDTTYTITATGPGGTATRSLFIRTVAGADLTYKYVRYTPVKLRGGDTTIQLSNFGFTLDGVPVPVTSVSSPDGTVQPGEEIAQLIDDESGVGATKWLSGNLAPVIFEFTNPATFDSYTFSTGDDAPERDPVQWYMEGSTDGTTWTLIENVTSITYPTTEIRNNPSGPLPFPGATLSPVGIISSSAPVLLAGESVDLSYSAVGSSSFTITPSVLTTGNTGTVTVSPTQTTTYTITSTQGTKTATSSVTVSVLTPTGVINYANFDTAPDILVYGNASILNDSALFTGGPDANRLRLTDAENGQSGTAWSISKMKVSDGFETTFSANLASNSIANGADGLAFIIQNTEDKYRALPDTGKFRFNANAVSIVLDSFPDEEAENGSFASIEVFNGNTLVAIKDISNHLVDGVQQGMNISRGYYAGQFFTTSTYTTPYAVRVVYTPGALSVYLDGTLVIDSAAVNLGDAGAVDADGKAWLGFNGVTGGLNQHHDIVDWVVTTGTTPSTNPLTITSSSFTFGATPQLALTFTSTTGKTYIVTESTDLVNWNQIGTSITASAASTSTTVPFTKVTKSFFRVEQTD